MLSDRRVEGQRLLERVAFFLWSSVIGLRPSASDQEFPAQLEAGCHSRTSALGKRVAEGRRPKADRPSTSVYSRDTSLYRIHSAATYLRDMKDIVRVIAEKEFAY